MLFRRVNSHFQVFDGKTLGLISPIFGALDSIGFTFTNRRFGNTRFARMRTCQIDHTPSFEFRTKGRLHNNFNDVFIHNIFDRRRVVNVQYFFRRLGTRIISRLSSIFSLV